MSQVLKSHAGQVTIGLAMLAALVAVGVYVASKVRAGFTDKGPRASEMLTTFRELYSQGELSDEEFRNIKTKLADRLQRELDSTASDPGEQTEPDGRKQA